MKKSHKQLLIAGGVAVVGYLLYRHYQTNKPTASTDANFSNATGIVTGGTPPVVGALPPSYNSIPYTVMNPAQFPIVNYLVDNGAQFYNGRPRAFLIASSNIVNQLLGTIHVNKSDNSVQNRINDYHRRCLIAYQGTLNALIRNTSGTASHQIIKNKAMVTHR